MTAPHTAVLLDAWERALPQPPAQRALTLLALAEPDADAHALAALPIGARDRRLLALRETLFGPVMETFIACPACDERLEVQLDMRSLAVSTAEGPTQARVLIDGRPVQFRIPDSTDLIAIQHLQDADGAQAELLRRCIIDGADRSIGAAAASAIVQRMSEIDRQAHTELQLDCPACAFTWQVLFDIAACLWIELNAWARRQLADIHVLASAYGWREADVLALSSARRNAYIEMVGA